ncbi:MAG: RDD family protein [Nakamurella sp.]
MNSSTLQSGGAPAPAPGLPDAGGSRCRNCGTPVARTTVTCPVCGGAVGLRSEFLEGTDPAAPRRRLLATAIDGALPLAVIAAQILLPAPSPAVRWSLWAVLIAWIGVLVVTEGVTGRTPGKALLRLRSVDVRSGRVIGIGPAAIRTPVKLVAGVGTLAIATLSYRWDPDGQERTWWDRAARSRVIDASVQIPGGTGRFPGVAAGTVDAVAARWAPAGEPPPLVTGVPAVPATGAARPVPSPAVRPAPAPAAPIARHDGARQRVSTPPSFLPSTAPPIAPAHQPPARPGETRDPGAPQRASASGPTGVGAGDPRRPRHAAPDTAPATGGPGPVQPSRVESAPALLGWGHPGIPPGPPGVVDDPAAETVTSAGLQEPTRVHSREELGSVPARVPGRPTTATLQWDTGARVVVGGTVLIGRDPLADDGEKVDRRLAVGRDSIGVSKTHLLLSITTAGVTVTDRHSTNGVRLEHEDGTSEKCRADLATPVRSGDVIRFGGRSITLPRD